jgi:hypothetical protein
VSVILSSSGWYNDDLKNNALFFHDINFKGKPYVQAKVGRTLACVKTCNSQDTMSATWCKERSTVETNEIMKTAAHRSKSWCCRQFLSLLSHVLILVLTQLVCGRPKPTRLLVRGECKIMACELSNIWIRYFIYSYVMSPRTSNGKRYSA